MREFMNIVSTMCSRFSFSIDSIFLPYVITVMEKAKVFILPFLTFKCKSKYAKSIFHKWKMSISTVLFHEMSHVKKSVLYVLYTCFTTVLLASYFLWGRFKKNWSNYLLLVAPLSIGRNISLEGNQISWISCLRCSYLYQNH